MISVLFVAFVAQTVLVYADSKMSVQLEPGAVAGRQIWHSKNCQACHQLYGFGGFLGPDLTNAASRLQQSQLSDRLKLGEGQMPKFELEPDEVENLWAFLVSMDESGIGQARNPKLFGTSHAGDAGDSSVVEMLKVAILEADEPQVSMGFNLFQSSSCIGCHTLFGRSASGAPDLSISGTLLSSAQIHQVLQDGRLPRMPPAGFTPEQQDQMQEFIAFMGKHREQILSNVVDESLFSFWGSVPWWEFR